MIFEVQNAVGKIKRKNMLVSFHPRRPKGRLVGTPVRYFRAKVYSALQMNFRPKILHPVPTTDPGSPRMVSFALSYFSNQQGLPAEA